MTTQKTTVQAINTPDATLFYREVGSRIRAERERQGLSQHALSKRCSTYPRMICTLESGKHDMTLHTVCLVVTGLGVDLSTLLPVEILVAKEEVRR